MFVHNRRKTVCVHTVTVSYGNIHSIVSHKDNCISACVTMTIKTRIDVFNPTERIKLISRSIPCDISVFVLRFSVPLACHIPKT